LDIWSFDSKDYTLYQNYPNPFNPKTTLTFSIPQNNKVNLIILDMLRREVTTLISKFMKAGVLEINFNPSALSSGVYAYQLAAEDVFLTKGMVLLK
jgi:hypothetical protein